jgi:uncharacterized membrane protein YecN with MAPEG domain
MWRSAARDSTCPARRVFPIPGSPDTKTAPPWPACRRARQAATAWSSLARPANGQADASAGPGLSPARPPPARPGRRGNEYRSGLLKAIRAHGNAAEYVPTLIVLFLVVGARSPAAVAVPLIAGATIARLVIAHGLLTSPSLATPTTSRLIGAVGTYLFGIGLAIAAVVSL